MQRESVWDYPRPPRLERTDRRIRVVRGGRTIVDSTAAYRVLETSHPPTYYVPPADIAEGVLSPGTGASFCEWKGRAFYWNVLDLPNVAWAYPEPTCAFKPIRDYVAFYCAPMDACYVDDELAQPQPGGFYGGWVTSDLIGPFKGEPGTGHW